MESQRQTLLDGEVRVGSSELDLIDPDCRGDCKVVEAGGWGACALRGPLSKNAL